MEYRRAMFVYSPDRRYWGNFLNPTAHPPTMVNYFRMGSRSVRWFTLRKKFSGCGTRAEMSATGRTAPFRGESGKVCNRRRAADEQLAGR